MLTYPFIFLLLNYVVIIYYYIIVFVNPILEENKSNSGTSLIRFHLDCRCWENGEGDEYAEAKAKPTTATQRLAA